MQPLSRREFLLTSALAGTMWLGAACSARLVTRPTAEPAGSLPSAPLPAGALDADTMATIDKVIAYTMEKSKVPGLAIGAIKDGKLVLAKGYGVAKQGDDRAVTPKTLFRVMDLTHMFTASAAVKLAEEGKLDLDAPIIDVLPYFELQDGRYKHITTRHLLSETAGLPVTPVYPSLDWVGKTPQHDAGALERYVRSLRGVTLTGDPGGVHFFSNMSYDIAGDVIAKASGQVFEDYMQASILAPLGMVHSTFFPEEAPPNLQAAPHEIVHWPDVAVSDLITYSRERAPSVGLLSSIDDLLRWTAANLNRGKLAGERILPESAYDQLWKPACKNNPYYSASDQVDVGLGWFLGTLKGHPVSQYTGVDVGFHAVAYLAPEENAGMVVLGNQFTGGETLDWYAYTVANTLMPLIAFQ